MVRINVCGFEQIDVDAGLSTFHEEGAAGSEWGRAERDQGQGRDCGAVHDLSHGLTLDAMDFGDDTSSEGKKVRPAARCEATSSKSKGSRRRVEGQEARADVEALLSEQGSGCRVTRA